MLVHVAAVHRLQAYWIGILWVGGGGVLLLFIVWAVGWAVPGVCVLLV
jgi:hypothetical protein